MVNDTSFKTSGKAFEQDSLMPITIGSTTSYLATALSNSASFINTSYAAIDN